MPLVVTHGWPGSVIEQLKIVDPLTNPTAHGASASDAFHLVIPSMPGYGFSGKPTETGWGPERIARAYVELMKRLGYDALRGDGRRLGRGSSLSGWACTAPPGLLGIHTNFAGAVPTQHRSGGPGRCDPVRLSMTRNPHLRELLTFFSTDAGYASRARPHPQTLYGIADSPIGLAAWMIDHDATSYGR